MTKIFFKKINGGQNCGKFVPTKETPQEFFGTNKLVEFCPTNHPSIFTAQIGYQAFVRLEDLPQDIKCKIRSISDVEHYLPHRIDKNTTWSQLIEILKD